MNMKYEVITAWSATLPGAIDELQVEVNFAVRHGGVPQGGVSVMLTPDGFYVAQAMMGRD